MNVCVQSRYDGATFREELLRVDAGGEHLFAVCTSPIDGPPGVGVLLVQATTTIHNRLWSRLGRELAARGVTSLSLDLHGQGESSGIRRDRLLEGQTRIEVMAGAAVLRDRGALRLVLVGNCWAALAVLSAADGIPETKSVLLVTPPIDALRSPAPSAELFHPPPSSFRTIGRSLLTVSALHRISADAEYRTWLARRAVRRLGPQKPPAAPTPTIDRTVLLDRLGRLSYHGVAVHLLYGEGEGVDHGGHPDDRSVWEALGKALRVHRVAASVHGHATLAAQECVRDFVSNAVSAEIERTPLSATI